MTLVQRLLEVNPALDRESACHIASLVEVMQREEDRGRRRRARLSAQGEARRPTPFKGRVRGDRALET